MWCINIQTGDMYLGDLTPGYREATSDEVHGYEARAYRAQLDAMIVSAYQAQAAIVLAQSRGIVGFDLDYATKQAIAQSTDPLVALAWNKATEFSRTSGLLLSLASVVGLNSDQIDQLFLLAQTITS